MANLPNHLYGSATRVESRRGWEKQKRSSRMLKHLVASCPRCKPEREIAEERRASVENC